MPIIKFNQPLGFLEKEIMKIIWKLKNASVRDVLTQLKKKRDIAYTTVMTVMDRLYKKKILKRELNDLGAYIYRPAREKQDFLQEASKKAIYNLIKGFGEVAVAQFIDVVESSNLKNLKDWRQKLKKIK